MAAILEGVAFVAVDILDELAGKYLRFDCEKLSEKSGVYLLLHVWSIIWPTFKSLLLKLTFPDTAGHVAAILLRVLFIDWTKRQFGNSFTLRFRSKMCALTNDSFPQVPCIKSYLYYVNSLSFFYYAALTYSYTIARNLYNLCKCIRLGYVRLFLF